MTANNNYFKFLPCAYVTKVFNENLIIIFFLHDVYHKWSLVSRYIAQIAIYP